MNGLIILGMHRSGTSLLANLLHEMGLYLGSSDELMAAQHDNPGGFFERNDVVALNDKMLTALGVSWDCPAALDRGELRAATNTYRADMEELIQKLTAHQPYLIKDPRMCLTLPLWQAVWSDVLYLFTSRHPLKIARSLKRRNGMPLPVGLALWEFYTCEVMRAVRPEQCLQFNYETLLKDPIKGARELYDGLVASGINGLSFPGEQRITGLVMQSDSTPEPQEFALSEPQRELYRSQLDRTWQRPDVSDASLKLLQEYSGVDQGADSRPVLLAERQQRQQEFSHLYAAHEALLGEHNSLADAYQADTQELQELRRLHNTLQQEHASLAITYQADSDELRELRRLHEKLQQEHSSLAEAYGRDSHELTTARQLVEERGRELQEANSVRDQALFELRESNHQLTAHQTELARQREQVQSLNAELQSTRQELLEAGSLLVDLGVALWRFRRSLFGRLVANLSRFYKLLTLRLGRPTGLEASLIRTQEYESLARSGGDSNLSALPEKFRLLAYLSGKAARSPVKTLKSLDAARVRNLHKVVFDMPAHQARLVTEGAVQRYLGDSQGVELVQYAGEPLEFPVSDQPLVSILLPVYNELATTLDCLQAILKHTDAERTPYQVVVADDCSSDDTEHLERYVSGVKVVRQPTNQGFLRNCNRAAQHCDGEYLLLLNNDTIVQPNWLAPMLDLLRRDSSIGLTGAKLLFPNGKLQEAGGIIWRDASGWNWGHSQDPQAPEFNYQRDVDYVSGACMMLAKTLWDQLQGFDEHFLPAYYEDTDLAFRVREQGLRVVYQPESEVVHLEGVSHGTDESTGIKQYQVQNQQKFRERWAHRLDESHYPNGESVFLARERVQGRPLMLVVDHHVPHFDQDAGSRCCYHYIRLFQKAGLKVVFLGDNFYPHQPYTRELQAAGVEVLYGNWYAKNWRDWLRSNGHYFAYTFLQRPHIVGPYIDVLQELPQRPKLLYFGHDLHFLRIERQAELEKSQALREEAAQWRQREFELFNRVDEVLYPSAHEVELIQNIEPSINARAIPLYIYQDWQRTVPELTNRSGLLFVGGYGHPPNLDAIMWFIERVFPLVLKQRPQISLHVIGSNPPDALKNIEHANIQVHGRVSEPELEALYAQVRLAIVPLRYGAGVKGKVLESFSKGVPVVTTTIGAEGIPDAPGKMRIADEPATFAVAVQELLSDDEAWRELSGAGIDCIAQHFSEQHVLNTLFDELGIHSNMS